MRRTWMARMRHRLEADSGFSLIEAIVALSILAIVSSSFTFGMNLALRVTRDDRLRQQATHLAERELEIVRNTFQHSDDSGQLGVLQAGQVTNDAPLPGGTKGNPLVIDGRSFTVERTNSIQTNGNGQSACDGGGTVDYLTIGVNVRVSWSDAGQAHAVESNTLLTPVKGVEGDVGYIAAKLTDADGAGTGNVPVVATGPSGSVTEYTAADGCAVFLLATSGSYTIKLNSAGYVNQEGFQSAEKSATLEKGKLKVIPFSYGPAAAISASYATAAGHGLPTPLPGLTLFNSGLPAPGELHKPGSTNPRRCQGCGPMRVGTPYGRDLRPERPGPEPVELPTAHRGSGAWGSNNTSDRAPRPDSDQDDRRAGPPPARGRDRDGRGHPCGDPRGLDRL